MIIGLNLSTFNGICQLEHYSYILFRFTCKMDCWEVLEIEWQRMQSSATRQIWEETVVGYKNKKEERTKNGTL